ncbi:MAG: PAS domain S-box protein [Thermoanaerobaculia bacterium]|nr:MAG: PAS domain S-box protein [Thermoanaerobaculia bacterium]
MERELQHFRDLVAHSSDGIYRLDFDPPVPLDVPVAERVEALLARGRIGAANDAMARMYGWQSGAQMRGRSVRELLVAEDPVTRASLEAFFAGGCRYEDVESVERDREGRRRVFVNTATGTLEGGRLVAAWGTQRDVTAERDALERLSESEQLFAAAFQDSPSGLSISSLEDGRLEAVNDTFLEWSGRTREEVIGRTSIELGLWPDAGSRRRLIDGVLRDGIVRDFPHVLPTRDGGRLDLRLSARRIVVGGRPCLLLSGENVTEIERAHRDLAEKERRFALLFHANPGPLALSRLADGCFIDVNRAFAETVGLRREDLLGKSAIEIGLWPSAEDRNRAFAPLVEHGRALRVPARVRRADGEIREARISGITLQLEGEPCLLVLAEDVTELNRAQGALAESEARLRAATEGSLDAFMLLDAVRDETGRVVDFRLAGINQVAERLSGRRREELLGGSLLGSCPVHRSPTPLIDHYREAFESGRPWEEEFEIRDRGLRRRWLREQVVPLEQGVAIWARDVTEKHAAEEERRRLEAEFHRGQRLESLGLLAGGVAHDFNNLLTGILGYAEMALRRLPAGAEAASPVREIASAAQRAADLTQKMLAFAGGGALTFAWISLNEVVEEMVELARPALPAGRRIEVRLGRPAPGLEADATQMRQVVLNLVLNASEAIAGERGSIEVETGEVYCETERLAAAVLGAELAEGRFAFVRVVDDGAGMEEEVRERLFEPFFTTKFTGRGLGLAAVLGIVRAHHGAIEVDSEPGRGAAFTVLLPLAQPRA